MTIREPCICAAHEGEEHLPLCPWFLYGHFGHDCAQREDVVKGALSAVAPHLAKFKDAQAVVLRVRTLITKYDGARRLARQLLALASLAEKRTNRPPTAKKED